MQESILLLMLLIRKVGIFSLVCRYWKITGPSYFVYIVANKTDINLIRKQSWIYFPGALTDCQALSFINVLGGCIIVNVNSSERQSWTIENWTILNQPLILTSLATTFKAIKQKRKSINPFRLFLFPFNQERNSKHAAKRCAMIETLWNRTINDAWVFGRGEEMN